MKSDDNWKPLADVPERDTDVLSLSYAIIEKGLHAFTVTELLQLHRLFTVNRHLKGYYMRMLQVIVKELATRAQYAHVVHFITFVARYEAHLDASEQARNLEQMGYKLMFQYDQWYLIEAPCKVIAFSTGRTIKFNGIGEV